MCYLGRYCDWQRVFAAANYCDDIVRMKGFRTHIDGHCEGMTLEIDLSALVPSGTDYRAEGLC